MSFAADYVLFIFLASLGVVQLAALKNRLKGLYFIRIPLLNFVTALALVVGSFLWFFVSEPRNLPDTGGGLDGNQQAMFSVAAAVGAVLFTLATTSLLNAGFGRGEELDEGRAFKPSGERTTSLRCDALWVGCGRTEESRPGNSNLDEPAGRAARLDGRHRRGAG